MRSRPAPKSRLRRCGRFSPSRASRCRRGCRRCRRACSAISATTWCGGWSASRPRGPIRPTVMVVFDAARDEMVIVTPVRPKAGVSPRAAHEAATARLDAVVAALEAPLDHAASAYADPMLKAGQPTSNTTEAEYKAMVVKAKDYIVAGDAFQIVLSQRFTSRFDLP